MLLFTWHSLARKLCRHFLTASWDGFVEVLSNLAEAVRQSGGRLVPALLRSLTPKALSWRFRDQALLLADGLTTSLYGLQKIATLCIDLSI